MEHRICYLILHYKAIKETVQCVTSVQKYAAGTDYEIVIVDNGSGDGTGEKLKESYSNEKKITVIVSQENLGFARGNNLGFVYAKNKLSCDFICMMNNDTELMQDDFFKLVCEEYEKSGCAVIGPEIHLNGGTIQPLYNKPVTIEQIERDVKFMKRQLLYNRLHIRGLIREFFLCINRVKKQAPEVSANKPAAKPPMRCEGLVLRGCCLIFTPVYVNKFDGLNDATFMFREEEFLYLRLKENNMLSVYNPDIKIRHYEDAATDVVYTKKSAKLKFQFENDIKSCELLRGELMRLENAGCKKKEDSR